MYPYAQLIPMGMVRGKTRKMSRTRAMPKRIPLVGTQKYTVVARFCACAMKG